MLGHVCGTVGDPGNAGSRTGQPRRVQISHFHDGREVIAVASNFGGHSHPQWYHIFSSNLVAHSECELGGEGFRAAEVTDPVEYTRLYSLAERSYKTQTVGRRIPVLRLTPRLTG